MKARRLPLQCSILILLALAACVGPRTDAPMDPPLDISAFPSTLPVLARVSSRGISDISTRVFALILASEAARNNGLPNLAELNLQRAETIIGRLPPGLLRIELSSALAGAWIEHGRPAEALRLLTSGIDQLILAGPGLGTGGGAGAESAANAGSGPASSAAGLAGAAGGGSGGRAGVESGSGAGTEGSSATGSSATGGTSATSSSAAPDERTIQVLEDLIYAVFGLGNDGFEQLRRAVQRVYIIQDVSLRVSLLTRIAGEYQRRGIGQRAGILLEQAVAALDAIPDPANRIRGYAEVANRYYRQDDKAEAAFYADRAISLFRAYDFSQIPGPVPAALNSAVEALIEMGRVAESSQLIALLPPSNSKQELLAVLSRYYFADGQQFAAELILQQIIPAWEPGLSAAQYIYPMLRVTGIYSEAGDDLSAEYYLNELGSRIFAGIEAGGSDLDDFVLSDILSQTTALGVEGLTERILAELENPQDSIPALIQAHDAALARGNSAAADGILRLMLSIAGDARASEGVVSGVAAAAAHAGDFDSYLALLERLRDPYLASVTASEGSLRFGPETQAAASSRIAGLIQRFRGL